MKERKKMRKNKFVVIVDKPTLNSGLVKRLAAMYRTDRGELIATRTAINPEPPKPVVRPEAPVPLLKPLARIKPKI